jgi:hypothetical protein
MGLRFCNQWRHETTAGGVAAAGVDAVGVEAPGVGVETADAEGGVEAPVAEGGGVGEEELMIGSASRLAL